MPFKIGNKNFPPESWKSKKEILINKKLRGLMNINYTIYNLSAFMDGDIQECIDRLTVAENAERMKESDL